MEKETILIVEDEEDILELVRYNLESEGYKAFTTTTAERGLKILASEKIDLIVLDLMLPGMDGLEAAHLIKKKEETRHIPIIMLTARGEESDVVKGLEIGADDYITKPFSPNILVARIRAVIRRRTESIVEESKDMIKIHNLVIHSGRRNVLVEGKPVDLTFTEFQVLAFLARRPGWVFTRSQIVDAVRGDNYPVTDRSVDVQIVGLRKKLGEFGRFIETVRGVGYRFSETP